jgi:UDP-N-acetylglucosamine kinase
MSANIDTTIYQLNEADNLAIFSRIEKKVINSEELKSQKNPFLIIIGGQPGSGKSTCCVNIQKSLTGDNNALFIDMDELREFHPEYQSLNKNNDKFAALYTGPDAGKWSELLLRNAANKKYNIVYESTLKNVETICLIAQSFTKSGYDVSLQAMIVKPEISQVSTYLRYEQIKNAQGYGRYVLPQYHDDSVANIPRTLQAIKEQGLVSKIELYTRDKPLFHGDYKKEDIVAIANAEYKRALTPEETQYIRESWDDVRRLMLKRGCQVDELKNVDKLRQPYQEPKPTPQLQVASKPKSNLKI